MNLLLLCAGEGTRFRPHTLTKPKPSIPFLGIPLACYSLTWAEELPIQKLIANTYHLSEGIHQLIKSIPHGIPNLAFSDEFPKLMGSGGGIAAAANHLQGSDEFLVMNGDEVFLPKRAGFLNEALEQHRSENRLATLFVMEHPEVGKKFGGVWANAENRIIGFGKTPLAGAKKGWHFLGAALYSKRLLNRLSPEIASNILYDDLTRAIQDGERVCIQPVQGWWHETGNEIDYLKATADCLQILFKNPPEAALLKQALSRFAEPWALDGITDSSLTLHFQSSQITQSSELEGWNVIGPGANLSGRSSLRCVVLGSGVRAHDLHAHDRLILA